MTRQRILNTRILSFVVLLMAALTFLIALAASAQQPDAAEPSPKSSFASLPVRPGTVSAHPVSKLLVERTATVAQDPGNISFLPAAIYSSGGYYTAQAVAIADLNGDGKPDIVVSNWYDAGGTHGLIGVLLGNGDGTFQPVVTYESGGAPDAGAVAVADVNGDAKLDIVVSACAATAASCGSANGVVSVLLGNGDGTFRSPVNYDSGAPRTVGVAIADLRGDDKPDLIVTNYYGENNGDGTVAVLLNNGEGSFRSAVLYDSGASNPNGVTAADVNGDGIPDLLVVNRCDACAGGGVLGVLFGKGDGTFGPVQTYPTGGANSAWLAVADMNGDGKLDVVVTNLNISNPIGTVSVLLGAEHGTFEPAVTYDSGAYAAAQPAIADLNGDGHLDIAVANCDCGPGPGIVGVLLGRGDGTFEPVVTFGTGAYNATAIAVADLNKDGKPDLVAANQGSISSDGTSSVGVLLNNTQACVGKCATSTTLSSSLNPSIYGQSVTWTATVKTAGSITPTGTVNFSWDGYSIGRATLNVSGVATLTKSNLNAYTYPLTATYSGDVNHVGSTSAILNQVVKEATSAATLISSPNPSTKGQAVTFTATITSPTVVPTGPVTFTSGTTVLGTAQLTEGKAILTTSTLAAGSTTVKATYSGDSNISESSASVTQTVQQNTGTSTLLTYSENPSKLTETFTATVTSAAGIPTGTVTFTVNAATLGTVALTSGKASLTTTTLAVGSSTVTATYNGDSHLSKSSAWVTQTFVVPFNATLYLQQEGGAAAATTEFGLGTAPTNFVPYYTGLPNSPNPTGEVLVGSFPAGTLINFGMFTQWGSLSGWAFSTGTSQPSLVAFADLSDSLGMNHSITQQTSSTTWLLHLDDALSYLVDDDNNDVLMQIRLVPQ